MTNAPRPSNDRTTPSILIVGAGLGGIALGVKLRAAGFDNFEIVEKDSGPGGTWWTNTYPGCGVDVPSAMYSYSFHRFSWSRTHARQPELMAYINDVIDSHDLRRHMTFGVKIDSITWSEQQQAHLVEASDGVLRTPHVVVSAVGLLSNPNYPSWPGMDEFQGKVFHTSQWDHSVSVAGKRVAIVGVGSTGTQIAPAIAPEVAELIIFQREPGWLLPKGERDYTEEEIRKNSRWTRRKWMRWKAFARFEKMHIGKESYIEGSPRNIAAGQRLRDYIAKAFPDRPDLQEAVTPKYSFSGKRLIISDEFYPTLLRDNVHLVQSPVVRLTKTGLVDAQGEEHEADVIVMATGFTASEFLASLNVRGRVETLREAWKDGAYALLGMAVPGFPNFYMMYGPNTNGGGPITAILEIQARYIVRNIKTMARTGATSIDVKRSYVDKYNAWLQRRLKKTTWQSANNYMKSASGRVVTQWPNSGTVYLLLMRLLRTPASIRQRVPRNVAVPSDPQPAASLKEGST